MMHVHVALSVISVTSVFSVAKVFELAVLIF